MLRYCKAACLLLGILFLLSGCAVVKQYFWPPKPETAQGMMEAGEDAFQDGKYSRAIKHFSQLKQSFPFSQYTTQAELKLADAYFASKQYEAAKQAYQDFESLHPGHEKIPYVLFRIGLSNFRLFKSIDLPQDHIQEAEQYFARVIQSHPGSQYAEQAEEYKHKCERYLAQHEIFVADFYWRTKRYKAAWKRYEGVAREYEELQDIRDYALQRGKLAYYQHQLQQAEEKRTEDQGSWKEWFDWL